MILDTDTPRERQPDPLSEALRLLRLHEARARYLLSYCDAFTQRVLRGELDQHILSNDNNGRN